MDHWNENCAKGEDDLCPVPFPASSLRPIETAPFCCVRFGGQVAKTLAGLRVNDKVQVMDTERKPIPGLYAGWTTAGGLCGENMFIGQWGNCSMFGSAAMNGVGGWLCARSICGEFEE